MTKGQEVIGKQRWGTCWSGKVSEFPPFWQQQPNRSTVAIIFPMKKKKVCCLLLPFPPLWSASSVESCSELWSCCHSSVSSQVLGSFLHDDFSAASASCPGHWATYPTCLLSLFFLGGELSLPLQYKVISIPQNTTLCVFL